MIYGLYLSAQGAQQQSHRLDVTANNLANAQTSAFKRDLAIFQAHPPFDVEHGIPEDLAGNLNESTGGLSLAKIATDFSMGPLIESGNVYDLALAGPGFLRVEDDGQQFLTRNGQLTVDSQGRLVTADTNLPVLTKLETPIIVPPDAGEITIAEDGRITAIVEDGTRRFLGQLDAVVPESLDDLEKVGNSLYLHTGRELTSAGPNTQFKQGFYEGSGTIAVTEMMDLIEASRALEANANMIKYQDDALAQLLATVSR